MEDRQKIYQARLCGNNREIPGEVGYSSRFSLSIRLHDGQAVRDGEQFEKLIIQTEGREYSLDACRFLLGTGREDGKGKIIFILNLYDFDGFFNDGRLVNFDSYYNNLVLVLAQKEKIKDFFIRYTSNLIFDLNVYQHFFDDLDRKIADEPPEVRESVTQTVLDTEGRKFLRFIQDSMDRLADVIRDFTREDHELHGFYLRKSLWPMILCSEFMTRTNLKPRGYAGDSEMMRMIYDNAFVGESIFSKLMYKYGVEVPAAQSVRNRRIMIPRILHHVQDDFSRRTGEPLRLMSVACGPAYELQDLFLCEDDIRNFEVTLLDQDEEALQEATDGIRAIEKTLGYQVKATYIRDSVRTMLREKDIDKKWGRFNFIYSMGLFDYLTPPVAKVVLEKMYQMLEPGGQILVGNYHVSNSSRWFMEYWLDWVLYYRTEDDMRHLLRDTDAVDINVFFEDSKCQIFLNAKKPL